MCTELVWHLQWSVSKMDCANHEDCTHFQWMSTCQESSSALVTTTVCSASPNIVPDRIRNWNSHSTTPNTWVGEATHFSVKIFLDHRLAVHHLASAACFHPAFFCSFQFHCFPHLLVEARRFAWWCSHTILFWVWKFAGYVCKFNTRGTRVTLPCLRQLYHAASPIGRRGEAVKVAHFSQARECLPGFASVEITHVSTVTKHRFAVYLYQGSSSCKPSSLIFCGHHFCATLRRLRKKCVEPFSSLQLFPAVRHTLFMILSHFLC